MRLLNSVIPFLWVGSFVFAQDPSPGAPVHPGQPANCNGWHTVVDGDDCRSVPAKYGISFEQFLKWNPAVSPDCLTNFWLKQAYCVRIGPKVTSKTTGTTPGPTTTITTKTSSSLSSSLSSTTPFNSTYSTRHPITSFNLTITTTDSAWPPKKTKEGQPKNCNNWHLVSAGDDCDRLALRYDIGKSDFLKWNPDISQDCSGLFADWYVCVGLPPQGDPINFGWSTEPPDFTPPPKASDHTRTTFPTANSNFVPSPSQGPMPTSCKAYHLVEDNQSCREIVAEYGLFTEQQFLSWNPVLKGNCNGLWKDNYYCVANYDQLPLPAYVTVMPVPLPPNSPDDCVSWYKTTGAESCANIALMFGTFDEKDFISWNPSVGGDCGSIDENIWYCVAKADTPKTRTGKGPTSTAPPTTRPTQSGVTNACKSWWLVGRLDTCEQIVVDSGVKPADLEAWNPALGANCTSLEPDKYICVGITD